MLNIFQENIYLELRKISFYCYIVVVNVFFWGKGGIFGVNYPGGNYLGGNYLGGNCPEENYLREGGDGEGRGCGGGSGEELSGGNCRAGGGGGIVQ